MPRLGVSLDNFAESRAARPDKYGRRVRHVDVIERSADRPSFMEPIYVKFVAGLIILATLSMSFALWRLFSFRH